MTTLLSAEGRLSRARYLATLAGIYCVPLALGLLGGMVGTASQGASAIVTLLGIACVYPAVCAGVKRLHDMNYSGLNVLSLFVPLTNLFVAIYLLFWRGTRGPNSFGPDPLADSSAEEQDLSASEPARNLSLWFWLAPLILVAQVVVAWFIIRTIDVDAVPPSEPAKAIETESATGRD